MSLTKKYIMQTDDENEAKMALQASALHCEVWGFLYQDLRSWLKHGHKFKTADDALEAARTALFERLEAAGINLDEVVN